MCVCTGYYRLATAEVELKRFDDAVETIKAGLKKQPGTSHHPLGVIKNME